MIDLSDLERDALAELVNMGVGRAATNLSRMVSDTVQLSVPHIQIATYEEARGFLAARERSTGLVAVEQSFDGSFAGRALLIFPEDDSLELARTVLGGQLSLEEVVDLEQDALAEIGNIILNGCLVVMANVLRHDLHISLPNVRRSDSRHVFQPATAAADEMILFLHIDFSIRSRSIRGYIALLMGLTSLEALATLIHGYINRITAGVGAGPR